MSDDLVQRLRADVFYGDARLANMGKHNPLHMEAADRIEQLEAALKQAERETVQKIVAWLMREEEGYPSSEYSGFAAMIREEIEAGEHLK